MCCGIQNSNFTPGTNGTDQTFRYVATGAEANPFVVNLPAARADANYNVFVSMGGPQANAMKEARTLASTYTTTQFQVELSAAAQAGDILMFHVVERTS